MYLKVTFWVYVQNLAWTSVRSLGYIYPVPALAQPGKPARRDPHRRCVSACCTFSTDQSRSRRRREKSISSESRTLGERRTITYAWSSRNIWYDVIASKISKTFNNLQRTPRRPRGYWIRWLRKSSITFKWPWRTFISDTKITWVSQEYVGITLLYWEEQFSLWL